MNIENMNNKNVKLIRSQNNIVVNVIHRSRRCTLIIKNQRK